jgi:alcohol dehydrogenase class IV
MIEGTGATSCVHTVLTHAVEGAVARQANPISEGLAMQAIRLISRHLPMTGERCDLSWTSNQTTATNARLSKSVFFMHLEN